MQFLHPSKNSMEEEKKEKKYQELKIKRDKLERIRDIFSIIRDLLIILLLIGLLLLIFVAIQFLSALPEILQNQGLLGLVGGSGEGLTLGLFDGDYGGSGIPDFLEGSSGSPDVNQDEIQKVINECMAKSLDTQSCVDLIKEKTGIDIQPEF